MKIIKKISLLRGLQRRSDPDLSTPKLTRTQQQKSLPWKLIAQQQLHKYGVKPRHTQFKWGLVVFLTVGITVIWKSYLQELYKNQLDTIYRYRYHQQQLGLVKTNARLLALKIVLFTESNLFVGGFFKKKTMGKQKFDESTQAIIRYEQYQNYIKKKDRKFDFLDIGILEKYPYAKKIEQMQ